MMNAKLVFHLEKGEKKAGNMGVMSPHQGGNPPE